MTDGESDGNLTNIRPKSWQNSYRKDTPHMSFADLPIFGLLLVG